MKKIINSRYFKWYRRRYLTNIYEQIVLDKEHACCLCESIYSKFICWKELKEVQENLKSNHIRDFIKENNYFTCEYAWFSNKKERLNFLRECLKKF